MATSPTPSIDQLKRALEIAEKIKTLESELATLLGGQSVKKVSVAAAAKTVEKPSKKVKTKKRNMSPEARERIAAAQRARWAKSKKA